MEGEDVNIGCPYYYSHADSCPHSPSSPQEYKEIMDASFSSFSVFFSFDRFSIFFTKKGLDGNFQLVSTLQNASKLSRLQSH
jgi:hypothetical protein